MQSQLISTDISKVDQELNLDLSPKSEINTFQDSQWFNFYSNKTLNGFSQGNSNKRCGKHNDWPNRRWGHSSMVYNKSILIFGGRHSSRSLVNIFSFDFTSLSWCKLDALGQTPPARDSHSAVVVISNILLIV